jgi:hypothetical protein
MPAILKKLSALLVHEDSPKSWYATCSSRFTTRMGRFRSLIPPSEEDGTFESILLDGKALLDSKATRDEASEISDRNAFICCRYR